MRIEIPQSSFPRTRLTICTPIGQVQADFAPGHTHFDYEVPEGVDIEEIGVRYDFFGNGRSPVGGGVLIEPIVGPRSSEPIVPVVDIPDETEDCGCGEKEACSQCDPEDEIAESDD